MAQGMLVDNAIVVLENITRNREEGMPLLDAVITGTGQVGGAITASTVTTIVVFLPIVYLHGASGELFRDQAWTVAFRTAFVAFCGDACNSNARINALSRKRARKKFLLPHCSLTGIRDFLEKYLKNETS